MIWIRGMKMSQHALKTKEKLLLREEFKAALTRHFELVKLRGAQRQLRDERQQQQRLEEPQQLLAELRPQLAEQRPQLLVEQPRQQRLQEEQARQLQQVDVDKK
jgi:hypothetical protein